MTAAEYIFGVLGGPRVFKGGAIPNAAELRGRIKTGLPYSSLESVCDRFHLSLPEAATVLHVPLRTLARRKEGRRRARRGCVRGSPGSRIGCGSGSGPPLLALCLR
jgi:hypothetical protein